MQEILRKLIDEVTERGHLAPLLHKTSLSVRLISGEEEAILQIENGVIELLESINMTTNAVIEGDKAVMQALLTGKMKLRKASEAEQLEWQGSIRASLLLESFFSLAIPKYGEEKTEIFEKSIDLT
ncbi:hypothetical protein [Robertmurraya massiliosenegalensis]|uniref:hypothetical protein n=1 Tax=Robertmurraya massiliosenegalensis TaxID=1287657 RepID=UPI0003165037|nr:hypothetical protein [Robertmurraya massiliosenegalensis]